MPFPNMPEGQQLPPEMQKQLLYQTLIQMGAGLLQRRQPGQSQLGHIAGNVAGGMQDLGGRMGNYQQMVEAAAKQKQDEEYRQAQMGHMGAQNDFIRAQIDALKQGKIPDPIQVAREKREAQEQARKAQRELEQDTAEGSARWAFGQAASGQKFDPTQEAALKEAIMGGGDKVRDDYLKMAKPEKAKSTDDIQEYEYAKTQGYKGSLTDFMAQVKRKPATGGGVTVSYGDKQLISKTLTELPKLKKEAISGANTGEQIDKALDLVTKGVTGKGGQVKSFLAPYAEMVGAPTDNMTDSQKFQLLTRAIIGPMRLEIVGPGPVSEWEQKLMQQISGGGGAAKGAATELLSHWKKLADSKVANYNDTLEGFTQVYPDAGKVYKKIERKQAAAPAPAQGGGSRFTVREIK